MVPSKRMSESFLQRFDIQMQLVFDALLVFDRDHRLNVSALSASVLVALTRHAHDIVPLAFDARSRRRELVRQAGAIDDLDHFGELLGEMRSGSDRNDG